MQKPVALVTGASSGIGQATAQRLVKTGYRVFGTSRTPEPVASPLEGVEFLTLDVRLDESVAVCVQEIVKRAGRIDLLVNNAGYALLGAVEETNQVEAHTLFETDFFGAVRMTQAVLPTMRAQHKGKIVLMSVILGRIGQPFGAFLSAAKHALEGFGESLHYELQPFGISVSLVEPTFVTTHADRALQQAAEHIPAYDIARQRVTATFLQAMHAGMTPEQVARVVEHIALARVPRLRYPVGSQARLVPIVKHVFPQGLFAPLARKTYGIPS